MALTNHIVPDSPTNNFATLNSLDAESATLSNGNLTATINSGPNNSTTIVPLSGIWYWEVYISDHTNIYIGIQKIETQASGFSQDAVAINNVGNIYFDASYQGIDALPSIATGDIISVFWDIDNKKIWFAKNGQFYDATGTSHPTLTLSQVASGVNGYDYSSNIPNGAKPFFGSSANSAGIICNFGQDSTFAGIKSPTTTYPDANGIGSFYYQPPTDALALCTANLPEMTPDVAGDVPQDYFKTVLWTGQTTGGDMTWDGTTGTVTVGFQPDLVWGKNRDFNNYNELTDSVRGATRSIYSNETLSEGVDSEKLKSFDSNGFSIGNVPGYNRSGDKHVAWCWKAGGAPDLTSSPTKPFAKNGVQYETLSAANITAGTITPTAMSVNTDAGFSIVKYGVVNSVSTIPHGLTKQPEMIFFKNLNQSYNWSVYHKDLSSAAYVLILNSNNAELNSNVQFNSTAPNESVFTVGTGGNTNYVSSTSDNIIAYCWHSVEGYSKFGSFTSASGGVFVYLGFKPALIISKFNGTGHWNMYDNARQPFNTGSSNVLYPDLSNAEGSDSTIYNFEFLSNGFRSFGTGSTYNSGTHLFIAFAEQPFKYSNAR